jgi:hypothetical protein
MPPKAFEGGFDPVKDCYICEKRAGTPGWTIREGPYTGRLRVEEAFARSTRVLCLACAERICEFFKLLGIRRP